MKRGKGPAGLSPWALPVCLPFYITLSSLPGPAVQMFFQTVAKPKRSWFIGAERVPGVEMAFLGPGVHGRLIKAVPAQPGFGGCFLQAFLVAGEESQGLSGICLRKTPMKKRAPKILPGQEWSIGVTRFLFGKRKTKIIF